MMLPMGGAGLSANCKIIVFLNLDIKWFIQTIGSMKILNVSLILVGNTLTIYGMYALFS